MSKKPLLPSFFERTLVVLRSAPHKTRNIYSIECFIATAISLAHYVTFPQNLTILMHADIFLRKRWPIIASFFHELQLSFKLSRSDPRRNEAFCH